MPTLCTVGHSSPTFFILMISLSLKIRLPFIVYSTKSQPLGYVYQSTATQGKIMYIMDNAAKLVLTTEQIAEIERLAEETGVDTRGGWEGEA